MPSIFEDVLIVANLHTNNTSYYSYGGSKTLKNYDNMGSMSINSSLTLQPNNEGTWEKQPGFYTKITGISNADNWRIFDKSTPTTRESDAYNPGETHGPMIDSLPIVNTKNSIRR